MRTKLLIYLQDNIVYFKVMKNRKKSDLPEKTCVFCHRPFTWRKKWERCWEEVKYCSDKCRMNKSKI